MFLVVYRYIHVHLFFVHVPSPYRYTKGTKLRFLSAQVFPRKDDQDRLLPPHLGEQVFPQKLKKFRQVQGATGLLHTRCSQQWGTLYPNVWRKRGEASGLCILWCWNAKVRLISHLLSSWRGIFFADADAFLIKGAPIFYGPRRL